jgi:uncharacterized membrane protein
MKTIDLVAICSFSYLIIVTFLVGFEEFVAGLVMLIILIVVLLGLYIAWRQKLFPKNSKYLNNL